MGGEPSSHQERQRKMTHRSRPGRGIVNLLLLAGLLSGCQSPPSPERPPPTPPPIEDHTLKTTLRNNSYALLYQLLEQEKDVSLLRFIKREHPDLKDILKKIAADSAAGGKLLKKFAQDDPSIDLNAIRLPPGEVATRDAIAAHEQKEILHGKGAPFEMTMLLNQAQAVNYLSLIHIYELTR